MSTIKVWFMAANCSTSTGAHIEEKSAGGTSTSSAGVPPPQKHPDPAACSEVTLIRLSPASLMSTPLTSTFRPFSREGLNISTPSNGFRKLPKGVLDAAFTASEDIVCVFDTTGSLARVSVQASEDPGSKHPTTSTTLRAFPSLSVAY